MRCLLLMGRIQPDGSSLAPASPPKLLAIAAISSAWGPSARSFFKLHPMPRCLLVTEELEESPDRPFRLFPVYEHPGEVRVAGAVGSQMWKWKASFSRGFYEDTSPN